MKLVKVTGDNEGLFTKQAYEELRLQMSTGDFHTHTAKISEYPKNTVHFDFDAENNEFFETE